MIRISFLSAALSLCLALPIAAQDLTGIARVMPGPSQIEDGWFGRTSVTLHLSQGVPFRVFTLDQPARLVVDFREVDWAGLKKSDLLRDAGTIADLRFGVFQPGWSRMVLDLETPMLPTEIGMPADPETGGVVLTIALQKADADTFAAKSGAPVAALWPELERDTPKAPISDDRFVVAIDPGHGGVDPGAERDGIAEKDLMLQVAVELREALLRSGQADVVLTREADVFVSLEGRVALAHRAGADLFLSLHADALSLGGAQGATVYTLSDEASDTATTHLAARHNRADIIAGVDLTGSDDEVAGVLLDLARQETEPRSAALAGYLVKAMTQAGGPMNRRPLRKAGFSVLKSADVPSVLVEIGFLSSQRDLDNINSQAWRAKIVGAMTQAILAWRETDASRRALVRQ